jgi:hypothetical protein
MPTAPRPKTSVILIMGAVLAVVPAAAVADPVRFLPGGDLEFDERISTFGSLGCHNTQYAGGWDCRALADGSVEIRNGGEIATISFVGRDQTVAVAANTPRPVTLGEIVGEATPGFTFPTLASPQWAMVSLHLQIAHGNSSAAGGAFWSFAPGGGTSLPLLKGPFAVGVELATLPDGYEYRMLAYQFTTIASASLPSNGMTPIVADVNAIPEPGTLLLLGGGLLALRSTRRRTK